MGIDIAKPVTKREIKDIERIIPTIILSRKEIEDIRRHYKEFKYDVGEARAIGTLFGGIEYVLEHPDFYDLSEKAKALLLETLRKARAYHNVLRVI